MGAGEMRERIKFQSRQDLRTNSPPGDGYGNVVGPQWDDRFTVWAEFVPLKGGEDVMAARLAGQQPGVIRIRYSLETAAITTAWRAVDTRTGRSYGIKAIADFTQRRRMLDLVVVAGANDG